MLITRNILNKALEDKVSLFHVGDFIDDDVFYDLFYAPRVLRNGKWVGAIPKEDRTILCAELKEYNTKISREKYDKVYCNLRCKSCGKDFPFHITKSQIINRTFKVSNYVPIYGSPMYPSTYFSNYIDFRELFKLKFGEAEDIYVCHECLNNFVTTSDQEASEILKRKDKFNWFFSDESANDWRRLLFYEEPVSVGTKITFINGDVWTDAKYDEWQRKEEEERNHQEKLEEIRRQQKLEEEAEREKTIRENELFLARHQSNTPTLRYINKFCRKESKVDITDREIQAEALAPEGVNYEAIQKYNCKLYREYLQSPLWKIISSKVKWNAHNRCEKCGSNLYLEVHHTSYEFKGVEFLGFHTLECLCSKCHKKEHED